MPKVKTLLVQVDVKAKDFADGFFYEDAIERKLRNVAFVVEDAGLVRFYKDIVGLDTPVVYETKLPAAALKKAAAGKPFSFTLRMPVDLLLPSVVKAAQQASA